MSDAQKNSAPDDAVEIDESGKETKQPEEKKTAKPIKISSESRWRRFKGWYKNNKKKSIPLTLIFVLALLAAIPWSRYQLAALALKNNYSLTVVDSTTGTPISGASVSGGGVNVQTDGNGKATLQNVKVGQNNLIISKKYYKNHNIKVLVPIMDQKGTTNVKLDATGRQVKINVKNLINQNSLENVDIKVGGINAKTDKSGSAIIVLPIGTKDAKATLSAEGYNDAEVTVLVEDKTIKENNYALTPAGKVYFLSKLSGKIDVVKTNLDGSGRQTVLAGTGKEDGSNTVLLASRDWKYLALLAKRDTAQIPKLYLIETATDKLSAIEDDHVAIGITGWSDDNFVYSIERYNVPAHQATRHALKSFSAASKKYVLLDQSDAKAGNFSNAVERFTNIVLLGKSVVYSKIWEKGNYYDNASVEGKSAGIYSIRPDGSGRKTVKTWDAAAVSYAYMWFYEPQDIYLSVQPPSGDPSYFSYDGTTLKAASKDEATAKQQYNTYLLSPSGNETFWSDERDGKNVLFTSDNEGKNEKDVAKLSEYRPYGWYTNDYLLLSKKDSELYIMPKGGVKEESRLIKVTDYHKPSQNFFGYGGGYGGI